MVKYSFKPERCRVRTVDDIVEYLNKQLLMQNEELRRVLDSVYKDIEDLKRRG